MLWESLESYIWFTLKARPGSQKAFNFTSGFLQKTKNDLQRDIKARDASHFWRVHVQMTGLGYVDSAKTCTGPKLAVGPLYLLILSAFKMLYYEINQFLSYFSEYYY